MHGDRGQESQTERPCLLGSTGLSDGSARIGEHGTRKTATEYADRVQPKFRQSQPKGGLHGDLRTADGRHCPVVGLTR